MLYALLERSKRTRSGNIQIDPIAREEKIRTIKSYGLGIAKCGGLNELIPERRRI